ncbi:MAG TPA: transketolase [Patescibacteria group bacterium]
MVDPIHDEKLRELEIKANEARQLVIETLIEAGSGHSAGPLDMADIFTAFYFHILNHDPKNPDWPDRDRLVLSNGHICPIRYVTMAMSGYFPLDELKTLRKLNSRLQGHPHRTALPGLETTSGPLGEGLSQGIGIALAAKIDKKRYYTYVLTGDGELDEGNIWEAVMFAGKKKLNNLTAVVDRNNIQIDGFTEDVMPLEDLKNKFRAFNWEVLETDGHNIRSFIDAVAEAQAVYEKPTVIIAHTIAGKGVEFMEKDFRWHGMPPDSQEVTGAPAKGQQAKTALDELRTLKGRIVSEHQA